MVEDLIWMVATSKANAVRNNILDNWPWTRCIRVNAVGCAHNNNILSQSWHGRKRKRNTGNHARLKSLEAGGGSASAPSRWGRPRQDPTFFPCHPIPYSHLVFHSSNAAMRRVPGGCPTAWRPRTSAATSARRAMEIATLGPTTARRAARRRRAAACEAALKIHLLNVERPDQYTEYKYIVIAVPAVGASSAPRPPGFLAAGHLE